MARFSRFDVGKIPASSNIIGAYLPVTEKTPVITLLEGNTPLIAARYLPELLGVDVKVYFKFEGLNPTGSFKDRGMTMAVSKAVEKGAKAILCASTGNTSASAAAYAARAGIRCAVLIPEGKIALGKLAQALIHGAKVIQIDGNFDDALKLARTISETHPIALVNSINPDRIEGQKTAAFEVVDALGEAPDIHCIPVGNAGNITAYWKGYQEYKAQGNPTRLPENVGISGQRRRAARARKNCRKSGDDRDRDSHRQSRLLEGGAPGARRIRRLDR